MYHIIYKTTNPATGEYYFGKHSTPDLTDGYQGSGVWVKQMLAQSTVLLTEIHEHCESDTVAYAVEKTIVDDHFADPLCMNRTRGGRGGLSERVLTLKQIAQIKFSTASGPEIAAHYEVSTSLVSGIRTGRYYDYVSLAVLESDAPFVGETEAGCYHPHATKLTRQQLAQIKYSKATQRMIAQHFDVDETTVWNIRNSKRNVDITENDLNGVEPFAAKRKHKAKLADCIAAEIKFSDATGAEMSRKHNVDRSIVSMIRSGKRYCHITREHLTSLQ